MWIGLTKKHFPAEMVSLKTKQKKGNMGEQSALVLHENTYIPLLTQVAELLPPNIPAQCSPPKV